MKAWSILIAMMMVPFSLFGDLLDVSFESAAASLPPAKDPVSGEIVKVELEEGYQYHRHLCIYARTQGRTDNNWGFRSEVYIGMLWQYSVKSSVMFVDDLYVVELVSFERGETGRMQVESRQQLNQSLSDTQRTLLKEWQSTKAISTQGDTFSSAGQSLLRGRFLGIPIIKREGRDVLIQSNDDTIRALNNDFGLGGNHFIIIHDLANKNSPLVVRRIMVEGDNIRIWRPSGTALQRKQEWEETTNMLELIQSAYKGIDRSLFPGAVLHEPGAVWRTSAMHLSPLIAPIFHRIDQAEGSLAFATDTSLRKFQSEECFKVYNTRPLAQNRLLFKKNMTQADRRSNDPFRMWEGTLTVLPDKLEAFVMPSGAHSYVRFVYANGRIEHDREIFIRFWPNTTVTAEVSYETLYFCKRERASIGDKAQYRNTLIAAKQIFKESYLEDCPWIERIGQFE